MPRNVQVQILRGVVANIPTLATGELYFATDTKQLWVGSATGNVNLNASSGGVSFSTTEVNIASTARRNGHFTISGTGMTANRPVSIQQAVGPYTGKGSRFDEAEMDALSVKGKVRDASTMDVYWASRTLVRGNFKFDYQVA